MSDRLQKFIKKNKPQIPSAPDNELSFLLKKIERDYRRKPNHSRKPFYASALAIAACIALVATSILSGPPGADPGTLDSFAYEAMTEWEVDLLQEPAEAPIYALLLENSDI